MSLDKLDELLLEERHKNVAFSNKQAKLEALAVEKRKSEEQFTEKVESFLKDSTVSEYAGGFAPAYDNERYTLFSNFVDKCVEETKKGNTYEGHPMHMNDSYAKKIKNMASKIFRYDNEYRGKSIYDSVRSTDAQSFLNANSVGNKGKNKQENTMKNEKKLIQKINLLECLGSGNVKDWSSGIKTTGELQEIDKTIGGRKAPEKDTSGKSKMMNDSDYDKMFGSILDKIENQPPEALTESEIGFLLMGEFGLRPSSVHGLSIIDLHPNKGSIDVECTNNKSKQMFVSRAHFEDTDDIITKKILGTIYERATILNHNNLDENGNIPIITCTEQNLNQGFTDIANRCGVDMNKYSGKWKTLRHRYAQKTYDEIREVIGVKHSDESTQSIIAKSIAELNYLMGHTADKTETTKGYVKNIW